MGFLDKVFGKPKEYMARGIYPIDEFLNENARQSKSGLLATLKVNIGHSQRTYYDTKTNTIFICNMDNTHGKFGSAFMDCLKQASQYDTFMAHGVYPVSNFLNEQALNTTSKRNIKIDVGNSQRTYYDRHTNIIYVANKDNTNKEVFINAIMRCFQQVICVESGILYSGTDFGADDDDITDYDLFDNPNAEAVEMAKRLAKNRRK